MTIHPLDVMPDGATLHGVTASPARVGDRDALRVTLTDEVIARGVPDVDYIDAPTFVRIPRAFEAGTVEVDFLSRLRPDAPEYARAFAGVAWHISEDIDRFECAYVRPANGRKVSPPPPRDVRAVQYFAYPDWKFDRLRRDYPDGRFESGADIAPDEWINLCVEVGVTTVTVRVDGRVALHDIEAKGDPATGGALGLWVDIGTEAFFSNLRVTPAQS